MERNDFAAAEKVYRQVVRLSLAEAYSNLGLACYGQKKSSYAEEALTKAVQLSPNLFVPSILLGEIRFEQRRYREALRPLERAIAVQPDRKQARQLYAAALVGLKPYGQAIEQYEAQLRADPRDPTATTAWGQCTCNSPRT